MSNIVTIPSMISLTALIFHIVSIWFSVRVTSRIGLRYFNWMTMAMMVGLARRILDYMITFERFSSLAYFVRYIELAYFPILFSTFIILGFIQIHNQFELLKIKKG